MSKDKPTENRIFTGSDAPFNAERVGNLIKSPEFEKEQRRRISNIANSPHPRYRAMKQKEDLKLSVSLIDDKHGGDLLKMILYARIEGYSYKRIAKEIHKMFARKSLKEIVKDIKQLEKEALYRVQVALSKRRIAIPTDIIQ